MLTGCDVSSWQTVAQEAQYGHDFVAIKCTQGVNYVNPLYKAQLAWARTNRKLVMHYHFNNVGNARAEVDYFYAHADIKPGELVCLDMENGAADKAAALWALTFLKYLDSKVTGSPVIYVNQSWANTLGSYQPGLHSFPLWIADPDAVAGSPHTCGWALWTFHQYRTVPVDVNMFNGNAAMWAALAGINKPIPPVTKPPVVKPPVTPVKPPAVVVDHVKTRAVQTAVHMAAVDGILGSATSMAVTAVKYGIGYGYSVAYLQTHVGAVVDGAWGQHSADARIATIRGLQHVLRVAEDGSWGNVTQTAWEKYYTVNFGR